MEADGCVLWYWHVDVLAVVRRIGIWFIHYIVTPIEGPQYDFRTEWLFLLKREPRDRRFRASTPNHLPCTLPPNVLQV
jgi:hypothetical protein